MPNRNRRSPSPTMIAMVSPSESSRDETTSHEDFYTLTKDSLPQIDVINGAETMIVNGGCTEAKRAVDLEDIYFWLKNYLEDDKQKKISNKARHSSCVASKYDGIKKFKIFDDARCLRTFLEFSPCRRNYIMGKQVYIANDIGISCLQPWSALKANYWALLVRDKCSGVPKLIGRTKEVFEDGHDFAR
ncbi:uncharacterized protein LOC114263664 [Camellia sinensis]|uniref:uncharacterized protein LOC114263664 n=1 Tax=Camellia sinensis TaxID=4442 RepID=UPI00103691F9|nr:uncharacterized protein LOC114263664 [Camellia sinensis]